MLYRKIRRENEVTSCVDREEGRMRIQFVSKQRKRESVCIEREEGRLPSTVNIKPFNVPVLNTEFSSEVTQGGIYGFLFKYSNTKTVIVH